MEKEDYIFQCRKCEIRLYVRKDRIMRILRKDCEECGEEAQGNWVFIGEGNYNEP